MMKDMDVQAHQIAGAASSSCVVVAVTTYLLYLNECPDSTE